MDANNQKPITPPSGSTPPSGGSVLQPVTVMTVPHPGAVSTTSPSVGLAMPSSPDGVPSLSTQPLATPVSPAQSRIGALGAHLRRKISVGSMNAPQSIASVPSTGPTTPAAIENETVAYSMNPEDYDVGRAIGFGSSGIVYTALYKPMQVRVAIKMIELDRFERNQIEELRKEIQVMSLSKHPNVLPVRASFVNATGGSCLDIMKLAFPDGLDEVVIATILYQVLQGLDYLHKNGHIHRDVKAGNLLMDSDGLVTLADFGVSSSLMEDGERKGQRKTFVGTPCWMAPEVMELTRGYNFKADIWSFGIMAIELAQGQAPFAKFPPMKVIYLTLNNKSPTLDRAHAKRKYSKSFKDMIDSCLMRDPSRRPTAEQLLKHAFFRQAKKRQFLVQSVLSLLPPYDERPRPDLAPSESTMDERDHSWDFSDEEVQDADVDDPPVRLEEVSAPPRMLTSLSNTTSPVLAPLPHSDSVTSQSAPSGSNTVLRKSRFVVEGVNYSVDFSSNGSLPNLNLGPSATTTSTNTTTAAAGVATSSGSTVNNASESQVKKGRFSVMEPSPSSSTTAATVTNNNRPGTTDVGSLSRQSSLNEGELSDSKNTSTATNKAVSGTATTADERKGRFEVRSVNENNNGTISNNNNNSSNPSNAVPNSPALGTLERVGRFTVNADTQSPAPLPNTSSSNSSLNNNNNTTNTAASGTALSPPMTAANAKRSRFKVSSLDGSTSIPSAVATTTATNPTTETSTDQDNTSPNGRVRFASVTSTIPAAPAAVHAASLSTSTTSSVTSIVQPDAAIAHNTSFASTSTMTVSMPINNAFQLTVDALESLLRMNDLQRQLIQDALNTGSKSQISRPRSPVVNVTSSVAVSTPVAVSSSSGMASPLPGTATPVTLVSPVTSPPPVNGTSGSSSSIIVPPTPRSRVKTADLLTNLASLERQVRLLVRENEELRKENERLRPLAK